MNNITRHEFLDSDVLAKSLAHWVGDILRHAVEDKGSATLAVSGGSTPKQFFKQLSKQMLDWQAVSITLVDERWVDEDDPRSNARLVKQNLLVNEAAQANFIPLYIPKKKIDEAIEILQSKLQSLHLPFDAIILGMGSDGHTASFFPGGDNLIPATNCTGSAMLISMKAQGAVEPRITMTLPVLLQAHNLALHIEGREKITVLKEAQSPGQSDEMPVRYILRNAKHLEIFHTI